jgi:hypothetical protein
LTVPNLAVGTALIYAVVRGFKQEQVTFVAVTDPPVANSVPSVMAARKTCADPLLEFVQGNDINK